MPIMSNIVVTRPLTQEELKAQNWSTQSPLYDSRELLFYYRLLKDNRLLFGSRGDTTGRPADGERMKEHLAASIGRLFPAWKGIEITHYWRGLICATERMVPSLGRLESDPTVYFSFGYHGNGVALATYSGHLLGSIINGRADIAEIPSLVSGLSPRFPLASLRLWYLRAALAYYNYRDKR